MAVVDNIVDAHSRLTWLDNRPSFFSVPIMTFDEVGGAAAFDAILRRRRK